jgi:integrase
MADLVVPETGLEPVLLAEADFKFQVETGTTPVFARVCGERRVFSGQKWSRRSSMAKRAPTADDCVVDKNITVRCDGASFRVRMNRNGVRINETFNTLEEARAFRDRKSSDVALDPAAHLVLSSRVTKREAAQLTFRVLLERYEKEVTPQKKGVRAELGRIKRLKTFEVTDLPARFVTRDAIARFMKQAPATWSGNSLRKYLMLISAVFTTAIKRWGYSLDNPVRRVEVPSNGQPRNRRLETGEYESLCASLGSCRNPFVYPLFRFALETACRKGEMLCLLWKDVDLKAGVATLRDTKNGEDRTIPLSPEAKVILSQLPRSLCGRVFPVTDRQVRSAYDYAIARARRQYDAECVRQGVCASPGYLENLRFHDLRHEATSRLFEIGFDVMEAATVTGHKTLAMLKNYTHLRAHRLAEKMARVP